MNLVKWTESTFSRGPGYWLALTLIPVMPAIMCFFLVHSYVDSSPHHFTPNYPNDFSDYWHETESFRLYGFNTGYYTYFERPARAEFTHFGVHGPLYPVILGTLARIFGWKLESPVFYNMAFLFVAISFFLFLVRPKGLQLALTAGLVLTFWPIHLVTPTFYQESFHHGCGIILAALGYRYLIAKDSSRAKWAVGILSLLLFLSVLRFSWALFTFPIMYVWFRDRKRPLTSTLVAGGIFTILTMKTSSYMEAPGANVIYQSIGNFFADPPAIVAALIGDFFDLSKMYFDRRSPLEILLRAEILLCSVGIPIIFALAHQKKFLSNSSRATMKSWFPEAWFYCVMTGSILVSCLTLYLDTGFYRIFSIVFVFLSFLLLVQNRSFLVLVLIISHSFFSFGLPQATESWARNYSVDRKSLEELRTALASALVYDPAAPSPWCNTVLLSFYSSDSRMTQIPAGFGLSLYNPLRPLDDQIKSKYVLLSPSEHEKYPKQKDNLRLVVVLPGKKLALFENTKSLCIP